MFKKLLGAMYPHLPCVSIPPCIPLLLLRKTNLQQRSGIGDVRASGARPGGISATAGPPSIRSWTALAAGRRQGNLVRSGVKVFFFLLHYPYHDYPHSVGSIIGSSF